MLLHGTKLSFEAAASSRVIIEVLYLLLQLGELHGAVLRHRLTDVRELDEAAEHRRRLLCGLIVQAKTDHVLLRHFLQVDDLLAHIDVLFAMTALELLEVCVNMVHEVLHLITS